MFTKLYTKNKMELNDRHDDLAIGAAAGLPQIDAIASGVKNLGKSIVSKAKLKKAQKQLQSGGVNSLTPVQKDMLGISRPPTTEETEKGITYVNAGVPSYTASGEPAITPKVTSEFNLQKYFPYIAGVIVLIIIIVILKKNIKK